MEALKAQAVAARTYTLRRLSAAPGPADLPASHRGAVLCSDPGCCQAWKSREELLLQWGSADYVKNVVKVVQAVRSTAGLALKHGGELIDSVYHACCGGATEHASEVWGRSVPYLVAVRCVCAEYGFAQVHTVSVKRSDLLAMTAPGLLQGQCLLCPAESRCCPPRPQSGEDPFGVWRCGQSHRPQEGAGAEIHRDDGDQLR